MNDEGLSIGHMPAAALLPTLLFPSLLLASAGVLRADEPAPPRIGEPVGACEFVDVRFARHSLEEFGRKRALVLYFTQVDCPLALRYLPRLAELDRRFRERGVQFLAVYVGAGDTIVEAAAQALDRGVDFPVVKDWQLATARACGATRAGEVVVLAPVDLPVDLGDVGREGEAPRVRYRGRVDGQFRVGGESAAATRADLAEALEELLAGRAITIPETRAEGCAITRPPSPREDVTFGSEVAAILARRCVECHREGGDAPFALSDYADASAHAAMIGEVVELGRMPPWHASAEHGSFSNRRELTSAERRTLIDWTRTGAKAGDLAHAAAPLPPLPPRGSTWRIGEPDLVLATPTEMHLPADGILPYQYTVLPFVFLADTWVEAVEIRPQNPRVMHHCNLAHVRVGEPFRTENFITGQVPGGDPLALDPGTAVLIPAGAILGLQIHYVTTGREERDRIEVALRFPRTTVDRRMRHLEAADLRFAIPPGASSHPVQASRTFDRDAIGIGMYAHMHVRGRDMRFSTIAPGGERETLLLIPTYDFDWQASYRWFPQAQRFAKGTRFECLAHFDNSDFNPWNPDPAATVTFGLQTDHEMMYGFLFYVDADERLGLVIDPKNGHVVAP